MAGWTEEGIGLIVLGLVWLPREGLPVLGG